MLKPHNPIINMIGKTFNSWFVLFIDEHCTKKGIYYICKCICGHTYSVSGAKLRGNYSKSCRECSNKKKRMPNFEERMLKRKQKKNALSKIRYQNKKESMLQYAKEMRLKNPSKNAEACRAWRAKNKQKFKKSVEGWRSKNPKKVKEKLLKRKNAILKATIGHEQELESLKIKANVLGLTIDHIVPIQGKNVCGLNVPWNIQLIEQKQNSIKNNWFNDEIYQKWRKTGEIGFFLKP